MNATAPKVKKVANFGANEPFVARIVLGLSEIVDVTTYENKNEIKEAISEMFMNGLAPAFSSLQEIRKIESGRKERLLMDLRKEYFSFYDRLWAAYKDRMQRIIIALGYDLGFVFADDNKFKARSGKFTSSYPKMPKEFIEQIEKNRIAWQSAVVRFRNEYAQHQTVFEKDVQELLSLRSAEICFQNCWTLIEFILVHLMCLNLYGWVGVAEIPKEERDFSVPKKFRILYR